jgi:hypothetical protein
MNPNHRCVILVPFSNRIEPEVDQSLRILESRGYPVWRVPGYSAIDQGRCRIAYNAIYHFNFEELMWIDSDVGFEPNDFEKLRALELPISCGVYPVKGYPRMTANFLMSDRTITFGKEGGLYEVYQAATGFLYTKREVYENMISKLHLKKCYIWGDQEAYPWFFPSIVNKMYVGEDFSFSDRAKKCGYKIYADTTLKLTHWGRHGYTWEDVYWRQPPKLESITLPVRPPHNNSMV